MSTKEVKIEETWTILNNLLDVDGQRCKVCSRNKIKLTPAPQGIQNLFHFNYETFTGHHLCGRHCPNTGDIVVHEIDWGPELMKSVDQWKRGH